MTALKKSELAVLKTGSLVRVNLKDFEGNLALGVVTHFQVIIHGDERPHYLIVWVDMVIDGKNRPFEVENLDVLPRTKNGFEQEFIADLLKEAD